MKQIEDRAKEAETHSPWSRWSEDTQAEMKMQMGISGPFKWTEATLAAAAVEANGGEPKIRADGEADGRAAGNRKCGKCGQNGHNARTCSARETKTARTAALVASIASETPGAPLVSASTVAAPMMMGQAQRSPVIPGSPVPATRTPSVTTDDVPAPRLRSASSVPSRAGAEPELKTCGKCGAKGHNARTCGLPKKVEIGSSGASAPRGGYICGKCGKSGHNARTCKG